jgi:sugar phosphate isomerase/epimerase
MTIPRLLNLRISCFAIVRRRRGDFAIAFGLGLLFLWPLALGHADDKTVQDPETATSKANSVDAEYLKKWTPVPRPRSRFDYEKEVESDWVDDRFSRMDVGWAQHTSIHSPRAGLITKGLAIRAGSNREGSFLFDQNALAFRSYWHGEFLRIPPSRFGILEMPTIGGTESVTISDPLSHATGDAYLAEYLYRDRVVLEYRRDGCVVLESPSYLKVGSHHVWRRTIDISPHSQEISLPVGQGHIDEVTESESRLPERWRVVRLQPGSDEATNFWVALIGQNVHWPAADSNASPIVHAHIEPNPTAVQRLEVLIVASDPDAPSRPDWPTICQALTAESVETAVPVNLREWTRGGPQRWGNRMVTAGVCGTPNDGPFEVDTITLPLDNPHRALFFVGGFDFLEDGTAYVCTVHGDVWRVRGLDQELRHIEWQRFATGLYQPLGLKIMDSRILVLGRDRIVQLEDLNGDGEADKYATFCSLIQEYGQPHAYAMGLEQDREGNLYFVKSGDDPPHGGTLLKVAPDGSKMEVCATGFRHANGLGIGPEDQISTADNEGNWVPATRIDFTQPGGFYGHLPTHRREVPPASAGEPLCWLPRWLDNSAGGQVWVTSPAWRELDGQMLHLSFGHCSLNLVLRQHSGRRWQGAVLPLPLEKFESGIMRGRFAPHDRHLYVAGLDGWQTGAKADGCFQRVRLTDKPIVFPIGWSADAGGITLRFATPLNSESAKDLSRYRIQQWQYFWSESYGSPHYSLKNPGTEGQDDVVITEATLSDDGRELHLAIPDIRPVMQMHVQANLLSHDQKEVRVDFCSTIHFLPPARGADSGGVDPGPEGSPRLQPIDASRLWAWCIVPFDRMRRSPEERARMLSKLGIRHLAYDYRAEHVPEFEEEILACQRHGIQFSAWWFPTEWNAEAEHILGLIEKHQIHPQLWVMGGGEPSKNWESQQSRIQKEAKRIRPIAEAAARLGCQVGLYNHGGWFGQPENQIAIVKHLRQEPGALENIGIVYNLHHAHDDLDRFAEVLAFIKPHLLALNLNGMEPHGDTVGKKILPIGQGSRDREILQIIQASGYKGPLGVLNHTEEDAEVRLRENLDGLRRLSSSPDAR